MDIKFQLEDIAPGGRIGVVALATDYNIETDLRHILPGGVDMFTNRVLNQNPLTLENLQAMAKDITRAAGGILPGLGVNVMIYGCTSGTAAIGADEIERLIQVAQPGVPCTNPVAAASAALKALGAKKISMLTPYPKAVNEAVETCFSDLGFEILNIDGFGLEDDIEMTGIPQSAMIEAGQQICDDEADALFISCTALRSAGIVEELEQKLSKPVVTSNQALAWHCLKLLENPAQISGFGTLFSK